MKTCEELLKQLTLEEKVSMVHGAQLFQTAGVERLGIPPLVMSDGPMGVRQDFAPDHWMPAGNSSDYVTYLPCNSALASTWNRELACQTGSVLGEETRGRGKDVILAPGVNIKRSPLCGRNFEYFSEDPFLTKELAVPLIRGIQSWDVAACVKHFALNNQETERLWVDVEVDEEALRTIYLPAFYDAVKKADVYTLMAAYNLYQGDHCCQSETLLSDLLFQEWGFDGVVISDWSAVHDTRKAMKAGTTIEMGVTNNFDEYFYANPLLKMIKEGKLEESLLDEKVLRILRLMQRLHMLDGNRKQGAYNTREHQEASYEVAKESVVLLKNEDHLLPLKKEQLKKVLVIGENAVTQHALGGGSAEIKALYEITPYMGIKMLLGGSVRVDYVPGYAKMNQEEQNEGKEDQTNWQDVSLENGGGVTLQAGHAEQESAYARELRAQAVMAAGEDYDAVIFVGGLNHEFDSEGVDRADMKLPYGQDRLIAQLLEVCPDLVVVMAAGSPVEMCSWRGQARAIVWSWYAGMEGGKALADVLFGQVNPSGKLPESFYKTHTDCSAHALGEFPGGKTVNYREGSLIGYRYLDAYDVEPEFCFGHGLSYTTFAYSGGMVSQKDGADYVSCRITNTGDIAGKECVQVYLAPGPVSSYSEKKQIVQELKGFEKVFLLPGETKEVEILIEDWSKEKEIRIGSSSRDIRLIYCNENWKE